MALFYIVITIIFWGAGSFLGKYTVKTISPNQAYILEAFGTLSVAFIFSLLYRKDLALALSNFNIHGYLFGFLLGLGTITFVLALKYKAANIVVPLCALYPVVTVIMSIVLMGEAITLKQGLGIAFAIIACVLIA